ncbi:MAG: YihY/virulence factor BrkB family protein [Sporichthyaceae bacterium]
MNAIKEKLAKLDQAQQRKPALGIPIATVKKFSEDRSANLASMIAFWAFFSIFPLMLATVTLLGYVLPEENKQRVLADIAAYIPLLDVSTISGLDGNIFALTIGLASALWSGLAVVRVAEEAFNAVWEVPMVERPKFVEQTHRAVLALVTIGVGLIVSTMMIGFVAGDSGPIDLGPFSVLLAFAAAIVVDIAIFVLAFRLLTDRDLSTRDVLPGAVFAGGCFWLLQSLASVIITRHLNSAEATYGTFATVITMLWWFYLQAQLTLLGAQLNVVLRRRYYPRGLVDPPTTDADRRLLEDFAEERKMDDEQEISSHIVKEPSHRRPCQAGGPIGGSGGSAQRTDFASVAVNLQVE